MGSRQIKERSAELLELVGLSDRSRDKLSTYSKGMLQRFGLAQALLPNPRLLVLDEPSSGLDPVGMVQIREAIRRIVGQGTTVFLSSHLLFEVQQVADEITIINRGRSFASGTVEEVTKRFTSKALIEVELAEASPKALEALQVLPFVGGVETSGRKISIRLKTSDDVRMEISQVLTSSGAVVISITYSGQSLEDAFMALVARVVSLGAV